MMYENSKNNEIVIMINDYGLAECIYVYDEKYVFYSKNISDLNTVLAAFVKQDD